MRHFGKPGCMLYINPSRGKQEGEPLEQAGQPARASFDAPPDVKLAILSWQFAIQRAD